MQPEINQSQNIPINNESSVENDETNQQEEQFNKTEPFISSEKNEDKPTYKSSEKETGIAILNRFRMLNPKIKKAILITIAILLLLIISGISSCMNSDDSDIPTSTDYSYQQDDVSDEPILLTSRKIYYSDGYFIQANETVHGFFYLNIFSASKISMDEKNFTVEDMNGMVIDKMDVSIGDDEKVEDMDEDDVDFWEKEVGDKFDGIEYHRSYTFTINDKLVESDSGEPNLLVMFTPTESDEIVAKWTLTVRKLSDSQSNNTLSVEVVEMVHESAAYLFPYPESVNWPVVTFDYQQQMDDGWYEGGTVKYKNAYGNKVKSEYKLKGNYDGTLEWIEVDGERLSY